MDKAELQSFMKKFIYQGMDLSEDEVLAALEVVDTNKVLYFKLRYLLF